jgi:hypothetical protein
MPTPTLKPTMPAANGHAAPPRPRVDWEAKRASRQAAYERIPLEVVADLSKFAAKAQDPGVRAGRADVLLRSIAFQQADLV